MSIKDDIVFIVSANFKKAYPIIRSLHNLGFKIVALFYSYRSPVFSRFISMKFKLPNPYTDPRGYVVNVIDLVRKIEPRIVLPVGFIDNLLLSKYKDVISKYAFVPVPSYDSLIFVSNKLRTQALCDRLGIKYPKTIKAPSITTIKLSTPIVIKGLSDSSKPKYIFSEKMVKEHMQYLLGHGQIFQEFIPGFGVGYFVLAAEGEPLLEFCHRRVIEVKPSGGASIVACRYFDPRAYVYGRRIVKHLRWTGVLMVEFRKHLETGELYLMEINPKFWGSLELPVSLGYDFPAMFVKYVLYGEKPKLSVRKKPECFSWVLSGIHYLKENPKIWFKMLKYGAKDFPWSADVHLDDPPELLFSAITRFLNNAIFGRRSFPKLYLRNYRILFENIKEGIEALIFDLDGTLVKLGVKWNEVRNELAKKGFIRSWESITEALYRSFYNDKKMFENISKFIESYEMKSIRNIKPNSFLKKTFEVISKKIRLALVTKQTTAVAFEVLRRLSVLEHFSIIVGREREFERGKQILKALETLKVSSLENVFFIGDTLIDAYSAVKTGITPIIVTDNPYRYFQMLEYGVPVFTNINEPLKIILRKVM